MSHEWTPRCASGECGICRNMDVPKIMVPVDGLLREAKLAGRREMFAEVMRVVDLWTGTGALKFKLRALDPDGDA